MRLPAPLPRLAPALPVLLPLLPALLAGAHLTGLLFFLNPEQPVSWATLARGTLLYGGLFAPLSVVLHLALARRRRRPVTRLLPWTLTAVVAAGGLGDWVHASVFAYFLPPGINVQLIKTALWLSLGAVVVFYTALLHTLHGRRYGPRSRALFVLVALGTVYAMFDRRTSFRPVEPPPRLVQVEPEEAPRLVVVELRGATLDALLPLTEQGKLPAFRALLENGSAARLEGFAPARAAALEASWATAKMPYRHGMADLRVHPAPALGLREPLRLLPLAVGFEHWGLPFGRARAIAPADVAALPVWEILARAGRSVAVVGFHAALGGSQADGPDPGERLRAEQALAESGWEPLGRALAADRARLAAVRTALATPAPPAAIFVSLPGLETASLATFGGFVRADLEGERAGELRRAADAYATYLSGLDAELAALWEAIPEPRLLVVSSARGAGVAGGLVRFFRDLLGVRRVEGTLDGPPDGLLLARGQGIRRGSQPGAGRIVDLAPTLLYALGLPLARDFDGRVLADLFEPALLQRRALSFVPSFEGLPPRQALPLPDLPPAAAVRRATPP